VEQKVIDDQWFKMAGENWPERKQVGYGPPIYPPLTCYLDHIIPGASTETPNPRNTKLNS